VKFYTLKGNSYHSITGKFEQNISKRTKVISLLVCQPNVFCGQIFTNAVHQKRLEHSSALLRRLKVRDTKRVFFTDEKNFYLNPPISNQNNRVWSSGKKADVKPDRLIVQRKKFAPHVMVSSGVCFDGKGLLHFVDE